MGSTGGNQDIQIRVTLDAEGAITGLEQLGQKVDSAGQKAETAAASGFTKLGIGIISIESAFNLASRAFGALDGALARGGAVVDVGNAFERLSVSAGSTADVFLNQLQSATNNTITNFDLMREANEALTRGLTPKQFEVVAAASKRLADQFGGDTLTKVNQLSAAINRGSVDQLRLAGVTLDADAVLGRYASTMSEAEKQAKLAAAAIEALARGNEESATQGGNAADAFNQLKTSLTNLSDKLLKALTESNELKIALEGLASIINAVAGALPKLSQAINLQSLGYNGLKAKALEAGIAIAKFVGNNKLAEERQKSLTATLAKGVTIYEEIISAVKGTNKAIEELADKPQGRSTGAKDFFEDWDDGFQGFEDSADRAFEKLGKLQDNAGTAFENLPKSKRSSLASDFAGVAANTIQAAASGKGEDIAGTLFTGLATIGGAALGAAVGGPIGGQVGAAAGAALGGLITSLFSQEDSASVKARKAADKYFADIFNAKRLTVIIDGQLKEIKDLVFGSGTDLFTSGAFDDALGALSEKAQQAFNGVGLAFGILLETGRDVAQQLGAIFANNLGGDLNNLQLLIQATGKSLEDLQGALVEAFLAGDASAIQTITSIQQLQELFTVGIPGAVGATDQAFQNLIDSGGRGRAAYDALIDVVAESKEKGSQSLEQLRSDLESTGKFTASQIDTLFKAFKDTGVTNFQQVLEASKETIIGILANIEAQGSLYSEQATQVQNLRTQLEAIPAESRKKIYFDVQTNFDSNTNKAINAGVFESPQLDGVK